MTSARSIRRSGIPERVSEWERFFYRALHEAGLRPIPQYDFAGMILDFALLEGNRRLAIEVDGEMYHGAWDGDYCRRDQVRNWRLMEAGWDVQRVWIYEIRDHLEDVVNRITSWHEIAARGRDSLDGWSRVPRSRVALARAGARITPGSNSADAGHRRDQAKGRGGRP
jgi:very-short-patch-repair endonuclease